MPCAVGQTSLCLLAHTNTPHRHAMNWALGFCSGCHSVAALYIQGLLGCSSPVLHNEFPSWVAGLGGLLPRDCSFAGTIPRISCVSLCRRDQPSLTNLYYTFGLVKAAEHPRTPRRGHISRTTQMGNSLSQHSAAFLEAATAGDAHLLKQQIECEPKLLESVTLVKRRGVLHLAAKQNHPHIIRTVLDPMLETVRQEYQVNAGGTGQSGCELLRAAKHRLCRCSSRCIVGCAVHLWPRSAVAAGNPHNL